MTFKQYDFKPTKLAKIQIRENVFVCNVETYPEEENGDCVPYSVCFFLASNLPNPMVYRGLTKSEINKLKEEVNVCKDEDCIDKMLTHTIEKLEGDPKIVKTGVITRYVIKLIAHKVFRFDDWGLLQKFNPSFHVKVDGSLDPYREKRVIKTSRCSLCEKTFNGYLGKFLHNMTFTCSCCRLTGELIDIGKMFGLQDGLLKEKKRITV